MRPDTKLENEPVPEPSLVFELAVVGLVVVLQHTPRSVTVPPPSSVMFPPVMAEDELMSVTATVVSVATPAGGSWVVKLTWSPYEVPTELVA